MVLKIFFRSGSLDIEISEMNAKCSKSLTANEIGRSLWKRVIHYKFSCAMKLQIVEGT